MKVERRSYWTTWTGERPSLIETIAKELPLKGTIAELLPLKRVAACSPGQADAQPWEIKIKYAPLKRVRAHNSQIFTF